MNIPQNTNNGNMMEMIKTNLMTMTMMNSMNGNSNKENNNGLFGIIFIFIITGLIDILCKSVIPNLIIICKEYYNEKSNKLINIIDSSKNNILAPNNREIILHIIIGVVGISIFNSPIVCKTNFYITRHCWIR